VAWGDRTDVAETEKVRGVLAEAADVADTQLAGQLVIGAGQLDRQGLVEVLAAAAEAEEGLQPLAMQGRILAKTVVRRRPSPLGAVVMLEGFEGNVLGVPHAPGLPAGDPVHRVDGALVLRVLRRAQQVVVLSAIKADGYGIVTEQVRYRRAVQAHVVQGWADALAAGLADVAAQLQTAGLLEQRRIEPGETVQSVDVDEQELFLEGVVFLQAAITGEGIDRVGDQSLLRVEATGLQPVGGDLQCAWSTG